MHRVGACVGQLLESVVVEGVDLSKADQIVAICSRGRDQQRLPILDLPLPSPAVRGCGLDRGVPLLAQLGVTKLQASKSPWQKLEDWIEAPEAFSSLARAHRP